MSSINVAVHGALGKMGQEVLRAVSGAPDMNPVGAADGMAEPGQISLPGRFRQRTNFRQYH